MQRIEYARGRNLLDNSPVPMVADNFEQFVDAIRRDRAPSKKGAAYICGPMGGDGKRSKENAKPRNWLSLDVDKVKPSELSRWREWRAQRTGAAWPTHSSRPDAPRERVIIPLDRQASREECVSTGHELMSQVRAEFGDDVHLDKSSFLSEQANFLPPLGVKVEQFSGRTLRVVGIQPTKPGDTPPPWLQYSSVILSNPLSIFCASSVPLLWERLRLERGCVPTDTGQRNACLFKLARHLKALKPDASPEEVREVAIRWHAEHASVIGTKAVMATVADLQNAYCKVRFAMGVVMSAALEQAGDVVLPAAIGSLGYGDVECQLLRICVALASQQAPGSPFFLSSRMAGERVEIGFGEAAAALRIMVLDGVLVLVEKGSGKRASRYLLGPLLSTD